MSTKKIKANVEDTHQHRGVKSNLETEMDIFNAKKVGMFTKLPSFCGIKRSRWNGTANAICACQLG